MKPVGLSSREVRPGLFTWQPDPLQSRLLQLGLGVAPSSADGMEAARFESLCDELVVAPGGEVSFQGARLDWGTARLLPLVAWRARGSDLPSTKTQILHGLLGAAMLARRVQDATAGRIVGELADHGVNCLVLKGAALGHLVYPDPGTRPMSDTDLLVRPEDLDRVAAWVASRGGRIGFDELRQLDRRRFRHSASVTLPDGEFDLHWRLLHDRFDVHPDRVLWDDPLPIRLGSVDAFTPRTAHHLVHAIVHGMRLNELSPVRWIADAALLAAAPDMDWDAFVVDATRRGVGALIARGLVILDGVAPGAVPDSVWARLSDNGPDHLETWCRQTGSRPANALRYSVGGYLVGSTNWSVRRRLGTWPGYLRYIVDAGILTTRGGRTRRRARAAVAAGSAIIAEPLSPRGRRRLLSPPA